MDIFRAHVLVCGGTGCSSSGSATMVKLILSSCHLRTSPGGDYDSKNDWTGQGSTLPLAGSAVKQGGYTWYPVNDYFELTDGVLTHPTEAAPDLTAADNDETED